MPFPLLYLLSDFLFLVLFYGFGYRKKVILDNIRNSFPEKSAAEHNKIYRQFYRHLCDLIVESLKAFTISEKQVLKRVTCKNPEGVDKYFNQGKSVIIAGGHYNNWEIFAVAVDALIKHQTVGLYTPLKNKFFDEKMRSTRSKYGLVMISTKIAKRYFEEHSKELSAYIFGFDQSPSNPKSAYWMQFLNQDTGVQFGTEKFAKEFNIPVVYGRIDKVKRGHYCFEFYDVTDNPKETPQGFITESITKHLEKDIRAVPQYWLWSHRRWKHKRPQGK